MGKVLGLTALVVVFILLAAFISKEATESRQQSACAAELYNLAQFDFAKGFKP